MQSAKSEKYRPIRKGELTLPFLRFTLCLLIASVPTIGLTILLIVLLTILALCFPHAMFVITPWTQVPLLGLLIYLLPREIARTRSYSLEIWDRVSNSESLQTLPESIKITNIKDHSERSADESDWKTDLMAAARHRAFSKEKHPELL